MRSATIAPAAREGHERGEHHDHAATPMSVSGLDELMDILAEWAADAPITVYVYGSRVRGDHRPDSDVDLYAEYFTGQEDAGNEWYERQRADNYSELRKWLPWPFCQVMPPFGSRHPFLFQPHEVARKRNVVALHTTPKATAPHDKAKRGSGCAA